MILPSLDWRANSTGSVGPSEPLLSDLAPILAVPEFKVPLPGGGRASQNDLFVIARSSAGLVCIMVEGKVSESFGPTLDRWRAHPSEGKQERLRFLLRTVGIPGVPAGDIRYQVLHRAASAVITGEQYRAVAAIVAVHSFSEEHAGWSDYESFVRLFAVRAEREVVQRLTKVSGVPLFGAWVTGDCSYLKAGDGLR